MTTGKGEKPGAEGIPRLEGCPFIFPPLPLFSARIPTLIEKKVHFSPTLIFLKKAASPIGKTRSACCIQDGKNPHTQERREEKRREPRFEFHEEGGRRMAFYHRGKGNNTPREEGKWMKKGGKGGTDERRCEHDI